MSRQPSFLTLLTLSTLSFFCMEAIAQTPSPAEKTEQKQIAPSAPLPLNGLSTLEWKQMADKGNFEAMMKLARFWLPLLDTGNIPTAQGIEAKYWATHWLQKAAKSGHPAPQFYLEKIRLGEQLANAEPENMPKEIKDILDSCEIRAALGDTSAILAIADSALLINQENFSKWIAPIRKKANAGDTQAQADLANIFINSSAANEQSLGEGIKLALLSAQNGNPDGMNVAGKALMYDLDSSSRTKQGEELLVKSATMGHIGSMQTLLNTVSIQEDSEKNEQKNNSPWNDRKLIRTLCDRGQLDILVSRGIELIEEDQDAPGGLSMLIRATEQGSFSALDALSKYYQDNGYNIPTSPEKSIEYASRLANMGGINGFLKMAAYYEQGFGVEKNETKAMEYIKKAVALHSPEARVEYARLLIKGIGAPKNPEEAFKILLEIEKQEPDTPSLNFLLGYMHEEGTGVRKNLATAFKYYSQGAEAGDAKAMNNLASMYELGSGVPQDLKKAVEWYGRAAESGNPDALKNIKKAQSALQSTIKTP